MKLSRQFPMNAIRVFETVARLGTFTRAAAELGMTQTAVSYQIKLLEEHIGNALFLRKPRQIELTPTGERILPKVTDAFALLDEAFDSAQRADGETLEIHAFPTFASQWLARHLGSFQLAHPEIAVRLLRMTQTPDFRTSNADVAIYWNDDLRDDIVSVPLAKLAYSPMLSPKLLESAGNLEAPDDLLKLPLITPNDPWWGDWFRAAGVNDPPLPTATPSPFESQDLEASAAMAGQGLAILSPFFFADELASGRLIQPFEMTLHCTQPVRLVYPHARRNTPKIKVFRAWLEEMMQGAS